MNFFDRCDRIPLEGPFREGSFKYVTRKGRMLGLHDAETGYDISFVPGYGDYFAGCAASAQPLMFPHILAIFSETQWGRRMRQCMLDAHESSEIEAGLRASVIMESRETRRVWRRLRLMNQLFATFYIWAVTYAKGGLRMPHRHEWQTLIMLGMLDRGLTAEEIIEAWPTRHHGMDYHAMSLLYMPAKQINPDHDALKRGDASSIVQKFVWTEEMASSGRPRLAAVLSCVCFMDRDWNLVELTSAQAQSRHEFIGKALKNGLPDIVSAPSRTTCPIGVMTNWPWMERLRALVLGCLENGLGNKLADMMGGKPYEASALHTHMPMIMSAYFHERGWQLGRDFPLLCDALLTCYTQNSIPIEDASRAMCMWVRGERLANVADAIGIDKAWRRLTPPYGHDGINVLHIARCAAGNADFAGMPKDREHLKSLGRGAAETWRAARGRRSVQECATFYCAILRGVVPDKNVIRDLADWFIWGEGEHAWTPRMDPIRYRNASRAWHAIVANTHPRNTSRIDKTERFPKLAISVETSGGLIFTQLLTPLELYMEGAEMKHCVATYADRAKHGECYIFKVTGRYRATLEIIRASDGFAFGQLRGKHNAEPPRDMHELVQKWIVANGICTP